MLIVDGLVSRTRRNLSAGSDAPPWPVICSPSWAGSSVAPHCPLFFPKLAAWAARPPRSGRLSPYAEVSG
eukprot:217453-Alexandrium_andersonii.AAC.1